jgi:hypothetical protein
MNAEMNARDDLRIRFNLFIFFHSSLSRTRATITPDVLSG